MNEQFELGYACGYGEAESERFPALIAGIFIGCVGTVFCIVVTRAVWPLFF